MTIFVTHLLNAPTTGVRTEPPRGTGPGSVRAELKRLKPLVDVEAMTGIEPEYSAWEHERCCLPRSVDVPGGPLNWENHSAWSAQVRRRRLDL